VTLKVTLKVAFKVLSKPTLYKPRVLVSQGREKKEEKNGFVFLLDCVVWVSTFSLVLSSSGSCIE